MLFYIFSLFAMLSSCFSLVWYIIDPTMAHDSDDPRILPFIEAILAPAYWGLFMTVLLSMHQLGIALQVVLGEIDKKGMKLRQRLAYVGVVLLLVLLSLVSFLLRNHHDFSAIVDMAASVPLILVCGAVFLFTGSKMKKLASPPLEAAIRSINL